MELVSRHLHSVAGVQHRDQMMRHRQKLLSYSLGLHKVRTVDLVNYSFMLENALSHSAPHVQWLTALLEVVQFQPIVGRTSLGS